MPQHEAATHKVHVGVDHARGDEHVTLPVQMCQVHGGCSPFSHPLRRQWAGVAHGDDAAGVEVGSQGVGPWDLRELTGVDGFN